MPVHIRRDAGRGGNQEHIAKEARTLLRHLDLAQHHLSILLCDDAQIQEFNRQFRDKDEATDVLSFPMDGHAGPLIGDLAISTDAASRQALQHGHDLATELRILMVHGLLHLLGHDHHDPGQTAAMQKAEAELLTVLGQCSVPSLVQRAAG